MLPLAAAYVAAATLWAQPGKMEFDVASVKASTALGGATFGVGNGGASERNVTLKTLIAFAYKLQEFQVLGGPSWVGSDRFDIEARTAARGASPDQLRLMLQSLFAVRFQLKLHSETREEPIYALVVGKDGQKIKPSADQLSPEANGPAPEGAGPNRGGMRLGMGSLIGNAVELPFFVNMLSQRLDRLVVDRTNLTGRFDIRLQWTPEFDENALGPGGDPLPSAQTFGPSLFAAIEEQLGLKLEKAKGPVPVFVVDHAERPSEN